MVVIHNYTYEYAEIRTEATSYGPQFDLIIKCTNQDELENITKLMGQAFPKCGLRYTIGFDLAGGQQKRTGLLISEFLKNYSLDLRISVLSFFCEQAWEPYTVGRTRSGSVYCMRRIRPPE